MAEGQQGNYSFSIKKVSKTPAAPEPPVRDEPKVQAEASAVTAVAPVSAAEAVTGTGGQFTGPGGALSFLGLVAGMQLAREAVCRRHPDGTAWWAEVERLSEEVAELVWAAGGVPYFRDGGRWWPAALGVEGSAAATLDVASWTQVEVAELLAGVALRPGLWPQSEAVALVVPGPVARWAVRRALGLGLRTAVATARRRPLHGPGEESGVLLVRLRAPSGRYVPHALMQALANLPDTVVGRPVGLAGEDLLVDVRCRVPFGEVVLGGMVPEGEVWALGAADVGHWRLRLTGAEVDGAGLLELPALAAEEPVAAPSALPAPFPVRVVPRPGAPSRVDAVLVDDEELPWLRSYLPGRPAGEAAFLLVGAGKHLLTGPGGLVGAVPFGVPLTRVGSGGLYLETGLDFEPPLPEGARLSRFATDGTGVVAVIQEGAFRFERKNLVPAWSLWVGAAPAYREELSPEAAHLLSRVAETIRRAEAEQARPREEKPAAALTDTERQRFLEQAQQAELAGDLLNAATLLERASEMVRAGRLYEQAARQRL